MKKEFDPEIEPSRANAGGDVALCIAYGCSIEAVTTAKNAFGEDMPYCQAHRPRVIRPKCACV